MSIELQFSYEQTAQKLLENDVFATLKSHAESIALKTSDLRSHLDFAIGNGLTALFIAIPLVNRPLEATDIQKIADALQFLRRSLKALEPVLCPRLMAALNEHVAVFEDVFSPLAEWLVNMHQQHRRHFSRACPGTGFVWDATFAAAPEHFTLPCRAFEPITHVIVKKQKEVFFEHTLRNPGHAYSIQELRREITPEDSDSMNMSANIWHIKGVKVRNKSPHTLVLLI